MADTKYYDVGAFEFEFTPNSDPYEGILVTRVPELEPYTAEINLVSRNSCDGYARRAAELCGMSEQGPKEALNALCSLRREEVAWAEEQDEDNAGYRDQADILIGYAEEA